MSGDALALLSVGACCPVGLDARQTAASLRAGIARKLDSPILDREGEPVRVGHLLDEHLDKLPAVEGVEELSALDERLLRIGAQALGEAAAAPFADLGLPLFLALPREVGLAGAEFVAALARGAGVRVEASEDRCLHEGAAGLFVALAAAREQLLTARASEFAIVGGVDSYLDIDRLGELEDAGRLRTSGPQDAFTPGEGAAFVIVGSEAACRRHQLAPLAWITGLGLAAPADERRTALARACAEALRTPPQEPIRLILAGLNGESAPAREWGVAALRSGKHLDPSCAIEHPAEFIGDAGTALAPIMIASAARWLRSGKLRGPALVWAGQGDERRGALLMYAGS